MMRRRTALTLPFLAIAPGLRAAVPEARIARLQRGLNITNWFRFPIAGTHAHFRSYISDAEIARFRAWGVDYIRLPVQPELLRDGSGRLATDRIALLMEAIRRLQAGGLAVMPELHPHRWHLEGQARDRRELAAIWQELAPRLRRLDPAMTFVEILNEPVFNDAPAQWHALQVEMAGMLRAALPEHTIVATGHYWSSLDGLLALRPLDDANVVYTFHYYRPQFWTTLGAGVRARDPAAIARIPWPQADAEACVRAGRTEVEETRRQIAFHCSGRWDAARVRRDIDTAGAWARRHGVNVIANEFGASAGIDAASRARYLGDVRAALEANDIGWALWGYDDSMGLARQKNARGEVSVAPGILRALGLNSG